MRLFFHKLFHWEYWPYKVVYIPIYFIWAYYALKARTIFFFNACNPSLKNGGFINDSKKEIYDLIPPQFYPKTFLLSPQLSLEQLQNAVEQTALSYPFFVKPDIGLRGSAVKKIQNFNALLEYHQKATFEYLLQELIPYENEVGIFYVRYPNEKKGRITGIVSKEYVTVIGDGKSTLEALIKQNPRYELQLETLKKEYQGNFEDILPENTKLKLVPYGNHCLGAKFIDSSELISPELTHVIDSMCQQIQGFYFGRMDLMYESWEALEKGHNFTIVELNGSASEPTHIYDPKHSLFFAWKELAKHIRYMFEIGQMNNQKGVDYLSHAQGIAEYKKHVKHYNLITNF